DAMARKPFFQRSAAGGASNEKVVDRGDWGLFRRKLKGQPLESFLMTPGQCSPSLNPLRQMFQLDAQNRRLNLIQPAVEPEEGVAILPVSPVGAQQADPLIQPRVGCRDHAAVPHPAQVFGGI